MNDSKPESEMKRNARPPKNELPRFMKMWPTEDHRPEPKPRPVCDRIGESFEQFCTEWFMQESAAESAADPDCPAWGPHGLTAHSTAGDRVARRRSPG
jgi:hypothetical protein